MRGKRAITEALIRQYPESLRPKLLVMLDQRLQDPYYLNVDRRNSSIKFYGSKEAFLANLYGDLEQFLENYTQ